MPESPDPTQLANQPFAAAMRRARLLANLTLDDWAGRLTETGAPASRDQAWKWESGRTIVPAYALEAARRALGRGMEALMGGDASTDPLRALVDDHEGRLRTLEVLMARLRVAGLLPAAESGEEPAEGGTESGTIT